ncbi:hypothetical protein [Candidatus Protochlamydia phocaeensis]|uniref:hypothetical protein n=1 Tax=Candidatus Protochlamydia phocaeensis TaxID=1414722 RepID=UPI000838E342|nr:hypothetical protein [Candidatus Protochlamydia phocaeensis]
MLQVSPFDTFCNELKQRLLEKQPHLFPNNGPQTTQDIYQLPMALIKIAQTAEKEFKDRIVEVLEQHPTMEIMRTYFPPVHLDFIPIINFIKERTLPELLCNVIEPNKLDEAAEAMDMLSYEGFGWTFGRRTYKAILQSSESLCVLARDKTTNKIVGFALGSLVETPVMTSEVKNLKIFHIWLCVRSASYPKAQFIKNLETIRETALQKFKPDILSLSVNDTNVSVRRLYENAGFQPEGESSYNEFSQEQAQWMVCRISENTYSIDKAALKTALWKQGFCMLGWQAPFLFAGFVGRRCFHLLWHR